MRARSSFESESQIIPAQKFHEPESDGKGEKERKFVVAQLLYPDDF